MAHGIPGSGVTHFFFAEIRTSRSSDSEKWERERERGEGRERKKGWLSASVGSGVGQYNEWEERAWRWKNRERESERMGRASEGTSENETGIERTDDSKLSLSLKPSYLGNGEVVGIGRFDDNKKSFNEKISSFPTVPLWTWYDESKGESKRIGI